MVHHKVPCGFSSYLSSVEAWPVHYLILIAFSHMDTFFGLSDAVQQGCV